MLACPIEFHMCGSPEERHNIEFQYREGFYGFSVLFLHQPTTRKGQTLAAEPRVPAVIQYRIPDRTIATIAARMT